MSDSKPITDDPNWTTGDLEIISADRVRFRAKRRWVAHASEALGDMMEGGQESIIEFTDERIETATALDIFLHLAAGTLTLDHLGTEGECAFKVLSFLQKWDCRASHSALVGVVALGSLISDPFMSHLRPRKMKPTTLFLLGAQLHSYEIIFHAVLSFVFFKCPHPQFTIGHDIEPKYIHGLWTVYHCTKVEEPPTLTLDAFLQAIGVNP